MSRKRCMGALAGLILAVVSVGARASTTDTVMLQDLQADLAQKAGLTGQGVVVGVISTGINGYQTAVSTGNLPASVEIVNNNLGTGSEGAAMMEVVHQIAPQATLAFCSMYEQPLPISVSGCAQQLVQDFGAQVIVDDVSDMAPYTYTPSPDSYNYDQLFAQHPSLIALHAAGNQQRESFVGGFVPATLVIAGAPYQVEDFGKAAGGASNPYETVSVAAGQSVSAELWSNQNPNVPAPSTNDVLGVWVLSPGGAVLASNQSDSGYVSASYTNRSGTAVTVDLAAGLVTQNNARSLAIVLEVPGGGNHSYPTLPINGQGGAGQQLGPTANVYSIAAVGEYSRFPSVEGTSDTGPATVYYSATEITTQNGVPILSYTRLPQPLVLNHPDLAGVDCIAVAEVNGFPGGNNGFCGTSAAAPTVGGVVALMLQAKYTKAEIMQSLDATAEPVPAAGQTSTGQSPDTWNPNDGYGVVQVWAALLNAGLSVPQPLITNPSGYGTTIQAGGTVNFAGSCTTPAGQTVTGYTWTFTDSFGATPPPDTTQQDPAVTFGSAGSYTANLTCTDSQGIANPYPQHVSVMVNAVNSGGGSSSGGGGGALGLPEIAVLLGLWLAGLAAQRNHAAGGRNV